MSCFTESKLTYVKFKTDEDFIVEFSNKDGLDEMSITWFYDEENGKNFKYERTFQDEPMTSKSIEKMFDAMREIKKDKIEGRR